MLNREVENFLPVSIEMRVAPDELSFISLAGHLVEPFVQIVDGFEFHEADANAEFRRGSGCGILVQGKSLRSPWNAAQHGYSTDPGDNLPEELQALAHRFRGEN